MKTSPPGQALVTPIAVRGYMVKRAAPTRRASRRAVHGMGDAALIIDTETATDASQRLLFGSYRYCRWEGAVLICVEEGIFYADELPTEDSTAFATLQRYARDRAANVAPGASTVLRFLSRRAFIREVFFPAVCEANALIVGFNLPFDLSRLAIHAGDGRGRYYNGFSFALADYFDEKTQTWKVSTYYARVCVKHIDSKRSFIGFAGGRERRKGKGKRGGFLDLKTLAFALTNVGHSLASACQAFNVEHGKQAAAVHGVITESYIDYNRRDVLASQELLVKLREEFDRHPISLDPCQTYSPASVAKAYLRALGLSQPGRQFPALTPEVCGHTISAYFGGRAEVRIRNTIMPVVYVDFLSMYPTANTNMGLWDLLTAESLDIEECTEQVQALLDGVTLNDCFARDLWRRLTVFAHVVPNGDVLPVRAQYSSANDGWNIGLNPLSSEKALWYAAPDLVESTLLTGKAPKVLRAFRLVPRSKQEGLTPVALRGRVAIDPRTDDFFRVVIEERKRLARRTDLEPGERARLDQFLKVLANAGSYGVFAEMNPEELRDDETATVTVHGIDGAFECDTRAPESSGPYCCPPIASLITSGARLKLAVLERCVTDMGGTYALCDTDSMAIVATEEGGLVPCIGGPLRAGGLPAVRALSFQQVRAICERFARLSPYDPSAVPGSILKIESENYRLDGTQRQLFTYAISAKRYALFERVGDSVTIVKHSEHGLGHLLNPTDPASENRDWIEQVWLFLVRRALGLAVAEPSWLDRPAISAITVSSPALLRAFSANGSYRARVKPMNFVLSAHVAPLGHPEGVDPKRFHLVAPFESDARKWLTLDWLDIHSERAFAIATGLDAPHWCVRVQSYRDVIARYATHPEPKSAAQDGSECDRTTVGLLARRAVRATDVGYVGKESNRVEDVQQGLVHSWDDVQGCYRDEETEWREVLLPTLRAMPRADAAALVGISERAVAALRTGKSLPKTSTRHRLRRHLVQARE